MLRYCNRLVVDSPDRDEKHIVKTLTAILIGELSNDLTLQNFFEDVPVSFKAAINTVNGGQIEMTAHKLQALVMGMEHDTLIRTSHLPHPVLARVRQVDDDTLVAKLADFGYVSVPANNRRHVWVHLNKTYTASFDNFRFHVTGSIEDLSLGGMAMLSKQVEDIPVGSAGLLQLHLGEARAEVPGTLLRISTQGGFVKYIFEMDEDTRYEHDIARFITRRQSAIIRKLLSQA